MYDFPLLTNLYSYSLPDIIVLMKKSFCSFRILLLLDVDVAGVIQVS